MVKHQRISYRLSYLDNAISQPSKMKLVLVKSKVCFKISKKMMNVLLYDLLFELILKFPKIGA